MQRPRMDQSSLYSGKACSQLLLPTIKPDQDMTTPLIDKHPQHYTSSNLFRVIDAESFERWCAQRQLRFSSHQRQNDRLYQLTAATDYPGWPHCDLETGIPFNLAAELATHLDPRDTATLIGMYANDRLRLSTSVCSDGTVQAQRFRDIPERGATRVSDPLRAREVAER